jgi:hypothetical protein
MSEKRKKTIQVSVWWPRDQAYGIPNTVGSMAEALAEAADFERLGYNKGGGEIHIIETTRKVTIYGR